MKAILAIILSLVAISSPAATNLLSLTYVNGTVNAGHYYASNIAIPRQRYLIQSLGITNGGYAGSYLTNGITNAITVNLQISIDGSNTNWVTLQSWRPSGTNAEVDSLTVDFEKIALPIRAQIITTNALGVSVFQQ
jgi:hypothetical protein